MEQKKIRMNAEVIVRRSISSFHYQQTPYHTLVPVLSSLQKHGTRGIIRRIDSINNAVGVQFPNTKEFLWFKLYEVEAL